MLNFKKSAILAGLGLALATSAFAAPNSIYVRADAGYAIHNKSLTTIDNITTSKGKLTYGLGLGYQFDNNFRADVTFHRTNLEKYKANTGNTKSMMHSNLVLANIYYDFAGINDSFVPYVTAGLGFGNLGGDGLISKAEKKGGKDEVIYNKASKSSKNKIAFSLGFGAAYKIADQVSLDVGYKISQTCLRKDNNGKLNNNQFLAGIRFSF